MDKYKLTKEESAVLNTVAAAMRTLPEVSQYNVLRNLAHFMDREVVKVGAVRAAAAVAGSVARAQVSEKPVGSKSSKSSQKSSKGGYTPEFLARADVKPLLDEKEAATKAVSDPPTAAQKERLKAASAALRDAWKRAGSSA